MLAIHRHKHRETALKALQRVLPHPSKLQTFNKTKYTKNASMVRPLEIITVFPFPVEELLPFVTVWETKLEIRA